MMRSSVYSAADAEEHLMWTEDRSEFDLLKYHTDSYVYDTPEQAFSMVARVRKFLPDTECIAFDLELSHACEIDYLAYLLEGHDDPTSYWTIGFSFNTFEEMMLATVLM